MKREFICIVCPNGCDMVADIQDGEVVSLEGAICKRGKAYVECEVKTPMRTIATSIAVTGGVLPLASVRLDKAVPKALIFDCMAEIRRLCIPAPVQIGDVVLQNVCGSDSHVIVTKNVERA